MDDDLTSVIHIHRLALVFTVVIKRHIILQDPVIRSMTRPQVEKAVEQAKRNMEKAAADLDFLAAAKYRDEMWALQQYLKVWKA